MRWLKGALGEVLGLFVDDGRYAIAILAWLALVAAASFALPALRPWLGPALFAGLAAILAAGAAWRARRG